MIARYCLPEMSEIWDDRNRYRVWLEVELAVCEELAKMRLIPEKDWRELRKACAILVKEGGVDPARVEEIENITRHDVIAYYGHCRKGGSNIEIYPFRSDVFRCSGHLFVFIDSSCGRDFA